MKNKVCRGCKKAIPTVCEACLEETIAAVQKITLNSVFESRKQSAGLEIENLKVAILEALKDYLLLSQRKEGEKN